MPDWPFSCKDDLKKNFGKYIHFERAVVWCDVNLMIIHLSEAFIPPSVSSSIHPFLQIILVLWVQLDPLPLPNGHQVPAARLRGEETLPARGEVGLCSYQHYIKNCHKTLQYE